MLSDITITIGQKIKELRTSNGMTQIEFARKLSVSPQAISKWENGRNMPDISMLPRIAKIFGISIDELFDL